MAATSSSSPAAGARRPSMASTGQLVSIEGASGVHSFLEEEKIAFSEHINQALCHDEWLTSRGYLPLRPASDDLFTRVADGILLCKLINAAAPDTLDERALNWPGGNPALKSSGSTTSAKGASTITSTSGGAGGGAATGGLNHWQALANLNLVLSSARAIGCQIVNVHAADLMTAVASGRQYLVLGLIWQIIRLSLLNQVNLRAHPELVRLCAPGEDLKSFMALPPEDILLRWFNYHLNKEGSERRVSNLSGDVRDGVAYLHLLNSVNPNALAMPIANVAAADPAARAQAVIATAQSLRVPTFIKPGDILSGNRRLNLAFTAQLFNHCPGLEVQEADKAAVVQAAGLLEDDEDAREARVFRHWLNSLDLDPSGGKPQPAAASVATAAAAGGGGGGAYLHSLDECRDGLYLLQALEKVAPGSVDWKHVNTDRAKLNKYKCVENCNVVVATGKQLGFSLVGISGADLQSGPVKLQLAFLWQLMRRSLMNMLQSIGAASGDRDSIVLDFANQRAAAGAATLRGSGSISTAGGAGGARMGGFNMRITSFKDPALADGAFLLCVLGGIEPRAINPELIQWPVAGDAAAAPAGPAASQGMAQDWKVANAKYAISVARKIGASIFLTWEDITAVRPKLIFSLLAALMYRGKELEVASAGAAAAGLPAASAVGTKGVAAAASNGHDAARIGSTVFTPGSGSMGGSSSSAKTPFGSSAGAGVPGRTTTSTTTPGRWKQQK